MSLATPQNRLRQIAVLVTSVDSTAASKLLMHLPTDVALKVRKMASNLGVVTAEEKRQVMAALQQSKAPTNASPNSQPQLSHEPKPDANASSDPTNSIEPTAAAPRDARIDNSTDPTPHDNNIDQARLTDELDGSLESGGEQSWASLGTDALFRFVQHERPAVIAVVVSQLPPRQAVAVLERMSLEQSSEVVQRLSRLQEIDPAAKASIDEHLEERLGQQREQLASENENNRRMQALLQAAPPALQGHWNRALSPTATNPSEPTPQIALIPNPPEAVGQPQILQHPAATPKPTASTPDLLDLYSDASINTSELNTDSAETLAGDPQVLPFAKLDGVTAAAQAEQSVASESSQEIFDRSLIQLEFERLLRLPPSTLATLLSAADSQTVLLALAGATPAFMQRFYSMLERRDARALQTRLGQIGAMKLRDIDEAQRLLVEHASALVDQRHTGRTARRQAA